MRIITPIVYAGLLAASIYTALAQTSPVQVASVEPVAASVEAVPATPSIAEKSDVTKPEIKKAAATHVGRRELCREQAAAKHLKGRHARDHVQICVAQARVECLRQAIDAKVRGVTQRRLYVRACIAS